MDRRTRNAKHRLNDLEGGRRGDAPAVSLPELSIAQLLSDGDGVEKEQKYTPIEGEPYIYEGPHGRLYQALYLRDAGFTIGRV
jgi:hypothetical protein